MEFKTIMQALIKDMAEQLRPMVADMVRQELAATASIWESADTTTMGVIAAKINLAALAFELTDDQLAEIAGEVDLHELAGKLDAEKIAEDIDLDHAIGEWFSNQSFTIRTN
jgi:hypothetical protein